MFDPQKSYLYPVLRPQSDDYSKADFEVTVNVERIQDTTAFTVEADFMLSDPDLLKLVGQGSARYVLQVRSPKTYYRTAFSASQNRIREEFSHGLIAGRTEFSPFLVATDYIHAFCASGWHDDYEGMSFDIPTGSVLAVDQHVEFTIDTTEEKPLGSIFELVEANRISDGIWKIDHTNDRVRIDLSHQDYARFTAARENVSNADYIMNSVYLPALIWLLQEGDRGSDELNDRRWFRALNARLEEINSPLLGSESNRVIDAQHLLECPFMKLPFLGDQDVAL